MVNYKIDKKLKWIYTTQKINFKNIKNKKKNGKFKKLSIFYFFTHNFCV